MSILFSRESESRDRGRDRAIYTDTDRDMVTKRDTTQPCILPHARKGHAVSLTDKVPDFKALTS